MICIDANVILRYILEDHAEFSAKAKNLISENVKVFASGFNTFLTALKGGVLNPSHTIKTGETNAASADQW